MISLRRITENTIQEELKNLGVDYLELKMFFGHYVMLQAILNQNGRELYVAESEGEHYLVMLKTIKTEYRFLFKEPSQNFLESFKEQYNPRYIGSNLLPKSSTKDIKGEDQEIIIDIDKILLLEHKSFRKKYKRALREGGSLVISNFSYKKDKEDILRFLEEWKNTRSQRLNQFAHIENDLGFLKIYGDKDFVKGIIIRDKERIVAYNLFISYHGNICTSCYNKVLRGYEELGVLLTVEKCKVMKNFGFTKAYLGSLNNDFKKSLYWAGEVFNVYSSQLYRSEDFQFKGNTTAEKYTTMILN